MDVFSTPDMALPLCLSAETHAVSRGTGMRNPPRHPKTSFGVNYPQRLMNSDWKVTFILATLAPCLYVSLSQFASHSCYVQMHTHTPDLAHTQSRPRCILWPSCCSMLPACWGSPGRPALLRRLWIESRLLVHYVSQSAVLCLVPRCVYLFCFCSVPLLMFLHRCRSVASMQDKNDFCFLLIRLMVSFFSVFHAWARAALKPLFSTHPRPGAFGESIW